MPPSTSRLPTPRSTQVALYFAFLECLTRWLVVPSLCGLVPMVGWVYYGTMDNWLCSIYSVVVLIWWFLFMKSWHQRNNELAYDWNCEHAREQEKNRFQFEHNEEHEEKLGLHTEEGWVVVADESEKHGGQLPKDRPEELKDLKTVRNFDRTKRFMFFFRSWGAIALFLAVSLLGMLFFLSFRVFLMTLAFHLPPDWGLFTLLGDTAYQYRVTIASSVAVIPTSLWRLAMNAGGLWCASKLTDRENHRLQSDYDDALLHKQFTVYFTNTFAALFYIAFLKATVAAEQLHFIFSLLDSLFSAFGIAARVDRDYCQDYEHFSLTPAEIRHMHDGLNPFCMGEVFAFLASTMALSLLGTLWNAVAPCVTETAKGCCSGCKRQDEGSDPSTELTFYARQAGLSTGWELRVESLNTIIETGYVVLFAPAFPAAAIFVYVVNIIKIRVDAFKLLKLAKRPLPKKVHAGLERATARGLTLLVGVLNVGMSPAWQVARIAGLDELLNLMGFAGLVTNTALIFFTATQFTTCAWPGLEAGSSARRRPPRLTTSRSSEARGARRLLPFTLPVLGIELNRENHFVFFVVCEHIVLLVQVPHQRTLACVRATAQLTLACVSTSYCACMAVVATAASPAHHRAPHPSRAARAMTRAQVAIYFCVLPQHESIAKMRTWSHFLEPKWTKIVSRDLRQRGSSDSKGSSAPSSVEDISKGVGPWALLTVPTKAWQPTDTARESAQSSDLCSDPGSWSIQFRRDQDRWSIDQNARLLLSGVRAAKRQKDCGATQPASCAESRVYGRISEIEPTTLTDEAKGICGIHKDACSFAFAYPLTQFVEGVDRRDAVGELASRDPLNLDLELDMHEAIYRMTQSFKPDPFCPKCPQSSLSRTSQPETTQSCRHCHDRGLLLSFLAVGGYVYFDKSCTRAW